jgi:glycosyltransferase involved in cell wall biosynthesis/GT2 family glycosyltransferase
MKIYILTNALDYGDAVSTHCILLKQRASELGIPAGLYAEFAHEEVRCYISGPLDHLEHASSDDILFHQFFNETGLMQYVERFPGRRVMMYHNITPPEYLDPKNPAYQSCLRGLKQARSIVHFYDYAVGMTDYSRRDLEAMGYLETGVFPLLVDLDSLLKRRPHPVLMGQPKPAATVFLFVGRIAPNKRIEDLIQFLAEYRRLDEDSCLILVGNDTQHPEYKKALLELTSRASLKVGEDVIFTGKVPDSHLVAYYRIADAFVCMSEHEGFGAPLVESMAFGLPTFAYAAPACEEVMGGAGVLFPEKDFPAIAARVREVLVDRWKKQKVLASQQLRLREFQPEKQRERLAVLIDRITRIPRPAPAKQRISVVINTYNRARQLERCLATLANQTYQEFEVVVVNGPSTDDTEAVLARHRERVRVARTKQRVLSVSRNEGIANACGDLIAFLDDDAVAHPRWLEELAAAFSDPAVGAAGGTVYRMKGRDIEFRNGVIDREGFVNWNRPAPGVSFEWEDGHINTVSGNNCMFRRAALVQIGGFDERIEYYHDEADVVIRLQAAGFHTVHRSGAIVYHEAAPSRNRKNAYDLNWFAISKNTLYCAVKNYSGPRSKWQMALRVSVRLFRERMLPMVRWWAGRQIGVLDLVRMELACLRGVVAGIWRGLFAAGCYRRFSSVDEAKFLPFRKGQPRELSICLLSQSLPESSPGGIATYTMALAKGLRDLGCEVHIVSRDGSLRSERRDGVWIHWIESLPLPEDVLAGFWHPTLMKNLEYSNGVRAKLLDLEARWGLDLVESPNWDAEGVMAALEHRHPMVVRTHSPLFQVCETQGWEFNEDLRLCSDLEGLLLRHADTVTGSTQALLSLVDRRFDLGEKKELVPLGLDVPPGLPTAAGETRTVLFVGRLERRKGIHTLLHAIPKVLAAIGNVNFEIVGRDCGADGGRSWKSYWEENFPEAARMGRVRFHGELSTEDVNGWYSACELFVAPSLYESFGLIYLEAMARAKPVVACRAGGVPEVVVDGETGLLVPPEDPESLAGAILRLLQDDSLRDRLGRAGRMRYERQFTVQAMAQKTLELYKRVAKQWRVADAVVWRAEAMDLLSTPDCSITFLNETGRVYLKVPCGSPQTAVYGPYMRIDPGNYRAEFKLWLGSAPAAGARLATVEAFSLKRGCLAERTVWAEDFKAGSGCVFDLFFAIPDPPPDDCEFRLHTTGSVPLYLREIVVRRWPHPSMMNAMHSSSVPARANVLAGGIPA